MEIVDNNIRVVITGMGLVCGQGLSVTGSWETMFLSPVMPHEISLFKTIWHDFPAFHVNRDLVELFPHLDNIKDPAFYNRTSILALEAARQAVEDAGLNKENLVRGAVIAGTTVGNMFNPMEYYSQYHSKECLDSKPVKHYFANDLATLLSGYFNIKGPAMVITNACSASTDSIGIGAQLIQSARADFALCGGSDELSPFSVAGFASLHLLAPTPCMPFDKNRNGLNLGEGAGFLILENEKHACLRNARIYGQILGYGNSADAYHPTAPHPDARGLSLAIKQALDSSGIDKDQIGLVNIHGTGTPANDKVEGSFLKNYFFNKKVVFNGTKGYTGHTLGAAGAIEAILSIKALGAGCAPPSAGFKQVDPEIGVELNKVKETLDTDIALSVNLAFGGNNSALILKGAKGIHA